MLVKMGEKMWKRWITNPHHRSYVLQLQKAAIFQIINFLLLMYHICKYDYSNFLTSYKEESIIIVKAASQFETIGEIKSGDRAYVVDLKSFLFIVEDALTNIKCHVTTKQKKKKPWESK